MRKEMRSGRSATTSRNLLLCNRQIGGTQSASTSEITTINHRVENHQPFNNQWLHGFSILSSQNPFMLACSLDICDFGMNYGGDGVGGAEYHRKWELWMLNAALDCQSVTKSMYSIVCHQVHIVCHDLSPRI